MTPEELDAIEARANAATAGPWEDGKETWEGDGTGGVAVWMPDGGCAFVTRWTDRGDPDRAQPQDYADADFIKGARADVPALVAEVRRLQGVLQHIVDYDPDGSAEIAALALKGWSIENIRLHS